MQHEQNIQAEQNLEKSAKEEDNIVHKRITGCPLMDHYTHYTLVNAGEWKTIKEKDKSKKLS